ncbi:uncharacterized protein METZ01_LOCUS175536 [marine metagenome]|uniref:Uncharacterized protein n=1 Tax=marine metagenome TaxID=408172 RepID=A0A382CA35_9ZZZZ
MNSYNSNKMIVSIPAGEPARASHR